MSLNKVFHVKTFNKYKLDSSNTSVLRAGGVWRKNGDNRSLGLYQNLTDAEYIVEPYCKGIFVIYNRRLRAGFNNCVAGTLIPEWACETITEVDPKVDVEYFI